MRSGLSLFYIVFVISQLLIIPNAGAVSLIAGVPNAETTPKNTLMIATESQFPIVADTSNSKRWAGFHFVTFGVSDYVEVASTVYNSTDPASERIAASLGYKWSDSIKSDDRLFSEWKFLLGQEFLYGLQGSEGFGAWSFAGVSNRLRVSETRFTLGLSHGTQQMFGKATFCLFAGVEQPLSASLSIIADWFSGTHDLAALITAIQYKPSHRFVIISGPKWANNPASGSNTWIVELTLDL